MLDKTDWEILQCLQNNSRMQWQEIGKLVHLTGQAVAARIRRMQDLEIIESFTITLNQEKLGKPLIAFITVFMKTTNHSLFQEFVKSREEVLEAHKISGEGCYWLKAILANQQHLSALLDEILLHGNYRINLSISDIKKK
ncbi:Lrp/AsnC family transcriptional regulator [Pelosinus sp. IPA-1]|uniref:Lrp/AsnC family transcriptional regulator n=1 Tax=Pelosinus sp. IPA-1 TaxID=3029569 RepID=UPI0024362750|nr:Lrp/AsnC family transcriptional regulator [Pelosinus sp. IPA-1]GMB02201.1 HTH-type transcriptional regulator LrpB [Pelosinus sp. IPA-1]